MIWFRFILGLVLFMCSAMITEILSGFGASLTVQGVDYLPDILEKVIDCLAGSLMVWGILKNPKAKNSKF